MTLRNSTLASLPLVLGLALLVGCYASDDEDDASTDPVAGDAIPVVDAVSDAPAESTLDPAPDFTLTDLNPLSPTYGEDRSVSDQVGKVLLIYFANFG
jgi:hypothetical protein